MAWAAARGIAKETHESVILYGKFGVARFCYDGSGNVTWTDEADPAYRGKVTTFGPNTLVCIH